MEKKKNYQKPTMRVVMLRHRSHLLSGSPQPGPGGSNAREMRGIDKDFEE